MFKQLLGDPNKRKLKSYSPLVTDINILEEDFSIMSDEDLRRMTYDFQQKLEKPNTQEKKLSLLNQYKVLKRVIAYKTRNLFYVKD